MTMRMPAAPLPRGLVTPKSYSVEEIETEAMRLQKVINQGTLWDLETCKTIAPLTLEINQLKKKNDVFLIAHSYQTPDIVYGVADSVSDSYSLSKAARDAPSANYSILQCTIYGRTAKIVSPHKTVLHPSPEAGCTLSDSITAEDVRELKSRYPGVPVACYINTSAEVKAEVDVCVTSSNYLRICEKLPGDRLIFVPDQLMGKHLAEYLAGRKEVINYDGECYVHYKTPVRKYAHGERGPLSKVSNYRSSVIQNVIQT